MTTIVLVLLIIAAVSFGAATIGATSRVNLVALGLLAWVLAVLVPRLWVTPSLRSEHGWI